MKKSQARWDPKKVTLFVIFIAVIIVVPAYLLFTYLVNPPEAPYVPPVYINGFDMSDDYNFIYGSASGSVSVNLMGVEEMSGYESELYEFTFENQTYLGFGRYLMTNTTGVYVTGYYEFNESLWREPSDVSLGTENFIIEGEGDEIIVYNSDATLNTTLYLDMPASDINLYNGDILVYDTVSNRYLWDGNTLELLEKKFPTVSHIWINELSPPKPILIFNSTPGDIWSYSGLIVKSETEGYNTYFEVLSLVSFHGIDAIVVHEVTDDHYYYFTEDGLLLGEKFNGIEFYGDMNA